MKSRGSSSRRQAASRGQHILLARFAVMGADGVLEMHEVKGSLNYIQEDAKVKLRLRRRYILFNLFLLRQSQKRRWRMGCQRNWKSNLMQQD